MKLRLISATLFLATLPCLAQQTDSPRFSGYITHITSPQNFEVNGQRVQLSPDTEISIRQFPSASDNPKPAPVILSELHPYLVEPAEVYGEKDKVQHSIHAKRLVLGLSTPGRISGYGIVEAVLPQTSIAFSSTDYLIRADGYLILITSATVSTFKKPLSSASDIQVNRWVRFEGTQREDRNLVAEKATFSANVVKREDLRHQTECDPPALPGPLGEDDEPACTVRLPKILPSSNSAMQAHISDIGARLIPKYQLALPATDTTRINFRFRLVANNDETKQWHDALTLPDGIILIPEAIVDRLENDSQIAAVLADKIACALEKQPIEIRALSEKKPLVLAVDTFAGGVTSLALDLDANHSLRTSEDQSERVSLWLLHDARYDVTQAPITWWLLAPKKPQQPADTPLSRRAAALYSFLGESWPTEQTLNTLTPHTPQPSAPAAQPSRQASSIQL